MIARAFRLRNSDESPALVFAKGVANSLCVDEAAYARERAALEAAIGLARRSEYTLVYFSAAPVYGHFRPAVGEQTPLRPRTRYGRHKAACERQIQASGVDHLILRLPNVVGSGGNPHQLIPGLTRQILQGEVTVFRKAGRDLLDVRDLVRLTCLLQGRTTGIVNVASAICTPSLDIVHWLIEFLGVPTRICETDTGDRQQFDTGLLRRLLGDEAAFPYTYPRDTLQEYVSALDVGRSLSIVALKLERASKLCT